jgi:predicted nucleic acid-binding protein
VAPVLADTNILLRLVEPSGIDYTMVRRAVDALLARGDRFCFAAQNLVEFWSVCTRPVDRNGLGLSIAETDARAGLIEARFRFLPDSELVHIEWRRLVVQHAVAGAQVHDARLVASMLVHGVPNILTLDERDFRRYARITAVHPRQVIEAE